MPSRVLLLKTPMARRAANLESSMMNVIICVCIFEEEGGTAGMELSGPVPQMDCGVGLESSEFYIDYYT
jgi:hypothetical protein